jgi:hypothetical protein
MHFGPNIFNSLPGRHWRKSTKHSAKVYKAVGQSMVQWQVCLNEFQNFGFHKSRKILDQLFNYNYTHNYEYKTKVEELCAAN